ncbi:carcinoembryonic antigen-related cell adhesion molecule 6-like [Gigantopelta aegis]|uniref:carcinoembryonic antigen-related cell adhesion molecule 6-like n=1 Tax=Gigantopelta aegis TaxID=1735272 RepID=UPI001B88E6C3|nr:carcinoembryonic antigen-related cell adhesion molecule 6-like [Gigantopelta aegis]XP_041373350.1 carcinoembryonic antigen-related cell adhesion molecule 6-like [Gigantopelta aegis]
MAFSRIIIQVILVTSLVGDTSVEGVANTSIDCMNGGYPGQSTTLTCTVTGTIATGIYWIRPDVHVPQVVRCNTVNTICRSDVSGYSAVINSPTQITLTIQSFNPAVDDGEWICRDGPIGSQSTCNITLLIGPDNITFNPSPPAEVRERSNVTINCTADCVPPCSYFWTWAKENISSTSLLAMENIGKKQAGEYMCTVTNTITLISRNKAFRLSVLRNPERMSALSSGAITGIVIGVVLAIAIPTVWILYKRIIQKKAKDVQNESND